MAATATTPIGQPKVAPPAITQDVRDMLARERARLAADPSAFTPPADLTVSSKYLFRSQPNTYRQIIHSLPMPPEEAAYGDEKKFNFHLRRWKATVAQEWYPDLPREEAAAKVTAELEALRDELGDTKFKFNTITRRKECFLATDSDRLAAYVRRLMREGKGEFATVYEVNPRARIVVGETAFPNTETGRRLAYEFAAANGIEDIKIVKE